MTASLLGLFSFFVCNLPSRAAKLYNFLRPAVVSQTVTIGLCGSSEVVNINSVCDAVLIDLMS